MSKHVLLFAVLNYRMQRAANRLKLQQKGGPVTTDMVIMVNIDVQHLTVEKPSLHLHDA